MAKNIFTKAKEAAATEPKKEKNDKLIVTIEGDEFAEALDTFAEANAEITELEVARDTNKSIVLEKAKEKFYSICNEKKTNIGSFIITSSKGGRFMFCPTKKYTGTIDENKANLLKEDYGNNIITENTTYEINGELLEKYGEQISKLIENSDLPNEVKENIIKAKTKFTIEKDTLDKIYTLALEKNKNIKDVVDDISPVFMIKTPESSLKKSNPKK